MSSNKNSDQGNSQSKPQNPMSAVNAPSVPTKLEHSYRGDGSKEQGKKDGR